MKTPAEGLDFWAGSKGVEQIYIFQSSKCFEYKDGDT